VTDKTALYKTIISKRDTRAYSGEPVNAEIQHRILTAGRMAGSAKNEQPLRYIVIESQDQKDALANCGEWATPLRDAALVIVLLLEAAKNPFDTGRAAQNMMLAAWAHGLASCPVSVYPDKKVRNVLGHPENYAATIALAIGHPKEGSPMSQGSTRISLDELVHRETW
jgi:nitroreductase